jgi:hypothetical protein
MSSPLLSSLSHVQMRFRILDSAHQPGLINYLSKYLVLTILKCTSLKKQNFHQGFLNLLDTLDAINGLNKFDGWATIADKLEIAFEHIAKLGGIVISTGELQDGEISSDSEANSNFVVIDDENEDG